MKKTFESNMSNGPQLYSFRDKIFFYGAYHILKFTEQEQGKKLRVTVDTNQPVCWIELLRAAYDGRNWVRWTTERGQEALVHTGDKPQIKPSFTWIIQPGDYTLYFVNSNSIRQASDESITYCIEVI